jgi:hypothetical protein
MTSLDAPHKVPKTDHSNQYVRILRENKISFIRQLNVLEENTEKCFNILTKKPHKHRSNIKYQIEMF